MKRMKSRKTAGGHRWATVPCECCSRRVKCRNVDLFKGVATLCGPCARRMEQLPITRRTLGNLTRSAA